MLFSSDFLCYFRLISYDYNNAYYSCNNILTIIFYEEQLHITLCFVRKIYGRIFLLPLVNKVYVKINAIENATIICPTLKFASERDYATRFCSTPISLKKASVGP